MKQIYTETLQSVIAEAKERESRWIAGVVKTRASLKLHGL